MFQTFIEVKQIGQIKVEEAEVTYVNNIDGGDLQGRVDAALSIFSGEYKETFLPQAEQMKLELVFPIRREKRQVGRLYIKGGARTGQDAPELDLTLTDRGKPANVDIKAALEFCAVARTAQSRVRLLLMALRLSHRSECT